MISYILHHTIKKKLDWGYFSPHLVQLVANVAVVVNGNDNSLHTS